MWNDGKSILLSRICVIIFMVLLAALAATAPFVVYRMFHAAFAAQFAAVYRLFLVTIYVGCVPAALLLLSLFLLLRRIEKGAVFIDKNVASLRHISWCCFAGAVISAVSAIYYIPWIMVAVSAAFMALVVRVVKNVFAKAVSLQDDADFTI